MSAITTYEVLQVYKNCGLPENYNTHIRTDINTGNLNNKLNTNFVSAYDTTIGHELCGSVKEYKLPN